MFGSARGEDVREPGGAELVAGALVERLVLAEHHAAQQRRLRRRQAGAESALCPRADGVDEAPGAAAALAGLNDRIERERGVCAAPRVVLLERPEQTEPAADQDHAAGRDGRPCDRGSDPQHHPLPLPSLQARQRRRAIPHGTRLLQQHRARLDPPAQQRTERSALHRSKPRLPTGRTGQHGNRREQRDRAAGPQRQRSGRDQQHEPRLHRRRQQPRDKRREHDMARMAPRRLPSAAAHRPSWARIAASFASPMPETSSSSSIEANPPCCSR